MLITNSPVIAGLFLVNYNAQEFFEMVVKTFEKVSFVYGGCYLNMTRFLESFSKVRLSNMMMELQEMSLAIRLFKQFLTDAE